MRNDGEIDYPEGGYEAGAVITRASHHVNNPTSYDRFTAPVDPYQAWPTYTTEWIPGVSVELFLDGVSIGKATRNIPTKPMHWTR